MFLPLPFSKFIPKIFSNPDDTSMVALASKANDAVEDLENSIKNLMYLINCVRCPSIFLSELNYFLNAGIIQTDSDRQKRTKIFNAIQNHKLRGNWLDYVKPLIDGITGYDARLATTYSSVDWILIGNGEMETGNTWAYLGDDGTTEPRGVALVGAGDEIGIRGNIFINCHYGITTPVLTQAQISEIKYKISFVFKPAYLVINLCYINSSGSLIIYTNGVIN